MKSDSDSDSDNMTLSQLKRSKSMTSSEPAATGDEDEEDDDDDDSDDDMTLSQLKKRTSTKRRSSKVSYKEVDSEDSEDDADNRSNSRKKRKPSSSVSVSISSNTATSEETLKHVLVGDILKRWQYCLPYWPDMSNVEKPPKTFIETGTKGVYVGIAPDNLGEIRDLRPRDGKAPIFSVLIKYPAKELKEDLINGIEKQQKALDDNKGRYPEDWYKTVSKLLKDELKTARALNVSKVESEYNSWARKNK